MCGFAGIVSLRHSLPDQETIQRMTKTLVHRGRDDSGYFSENNIQLGHQRLSIIDLSDAGHQPMASDNEKLIIVYNGEIYNFLELRASLTSKGYSFRSHTDTEVLLKLYEEKGVDMLHDLNGMFAFVIYDKEKNRLFMAGDRIGIKLFYYFRNNEVFLCASEPKSLLQHSAVRPETDFDALAEYLTFQLYLTDKILFKNIHSLLPGHYALLDTTTGEMNIRQYWDISYDINENEEDYFCKKLLWLFEDTTRLQIRGDVPVGTYLSGGTDSSLVTMLASKLLTNLSTFTGKFTDYPGFDESHYARLVADQAGCTYADIDITGDDFIQSISDIIYYLDYPLAGPGVFPQYHVSKKASRHVKVVLGGQGGDEIFCGYTRYLIAYFEQAIKGAIHESYEEKNYVVTLPNVIKNLNQLKTYVPLLQKFWKNGLFNSMDERYFYLINRFSASEKIFNKDLLAHLNLESAYERYKAIFNKSDTRSYINRMTYFDFKTLLPALLQVEDRMSMAHTLESRVPLLDHRIVEFVASIPPTVKFKDGLLKAIFLKAAGHILPRQIIERKDKMGFPVPLHKWVGEKKFSNFLHDVLLSDKARQRNFYNLDQVELLLKNEVAFDRQLWGVLSLELWFQNFFD